MLENSLHKVKKGFQTISDELKGKYIVLVNNNTPCDCFIKGTKPRKIWSEFKSLHASHSTVSEVFQNIIFLQNKEETHSKRMNQLSSLPRFLVKSIVYRALYKP